MRLFVAADISEDLRKELLALEDGLRNCHSLRFVEPDNIHLTLKFLGEVNDGKLEKVKDALGDVKFSGVKLATTKLGTFPGVLWLGVKLNSELAQLQQEVARAVRPFAMHDPRPFKPHLTIARFQSLAPEERDVLDKILKEKRIEEKWKVDSFILYKSTLTPTGPVYEPIKKFSSRNN